MAIQADPSSPALFHRESRERDRAQVRKLIEAELLRLAPGDPLPPVRSLMQMHQVSLARLQKVLGELHEEGLIDRRARSGNFKSHRAETARVSPFVDVIAARTDPRQRPLHASILEQLSEQLSKQGQGLRLHRLSADNLQADARALAGRSDVRSAVLLSLEASLVNEVFARSPITSVCLLPKQDPELYQRPCICTSAEVTAIQLQHLWELGHRRIGFLDRYDRQNPVWSFLLRRETYYRLMAEQGYRVDPAWVTPAGVLEEQIIQALQQMFEAPQPPTALIVSDVQLPATYQFMTSRGLKVASDLAIVGTDNLPESVAMHPPTTTVRIAQEDIARMTLTTLTRQWQGLHVEPIQTITPTLVLRSSTGPAPA